MTRSKYRGHDIIVVGSKWTYADTGEDVCKNMHRTCGQCGKPDTKKGHDPCLGTLPGVNNACCGHGVAKDSYIQFLDGFSIHGQDSLKIMNILKKHMNAKDGI